MSSRTPKKLYSANGNTETSSSCRLCLNISDPNQSKNLYLVQIARQFDPPRKTSSEVFCRQLAFPIYCADRVREESLTAATSESSRTKIKMHSTKTAGRKDASRFHQLRPLHRSRNPSIKVLPCNIILIYWSNGESLNHLIALSRHSFWLM